MPVLVTLTVPSPRMLSRVFFIVERVLLPNSSFPRFVGLFPSPGRTSFIITGVGGALSFRPGRQGYGPFLLCSVAAFSGRLP